MAEQPCEEFGGGGAWLWDPDPRCLTTTESTGTVETGETGLEVYVGGSCACSSHTHAPPWPLAMALLAVLLRRMAPALCALALVWPACACSADAQLLRLSDGGPFAILRADLGPAWGSSLVGGVSYAHRPVMAFNNGERSTIIGGLTTTELSGGLSVGRHARFGFDLPSHWFINADPRDLQAMGDASVSFAVSLSPEGSERASSWTVSSVLPTGAKDQLLGGPGAVLAAFSHQRPVGPLLAAAGAGLRLQSRESLPGVVIGNRIEAKFGIAQTGLWGWSVEGFGSMPLSPASVEPATVPFEMLGSVRRVLAEDAALRLGAGMGMGRGLGSPTFRLLATFEVSSTPVDNDSDGYVNIRDLCDNRPEDRDRYADWNGCPDKDNDRDGFLDPDDRCPNEPETKNGMLDDDGCPDRTSLLVLRLSSPDPSFERGQITVAGQRVEMLAEEKLEIELPPMNTAVMAQADGHYPKTLDLDLTASGRFEVTVPLQPIAWGDLVVHLEDPSGAPLVGRVAIGSENWPIPAEGASIRAWSGRASLMVASDGYHPRALDVVVHRDRSTDVTVVLEPMMLWNDGEEIALRDEIRFELGSSVLRPESALPLDAIARWLVDNEQIELLRVEGHADEPGSPRFNYQLSNDRALAVRDALIARGVQPERLISAGAGESNTSAAEQGVRRVTFLVLVWDDTEILLPPEIAPLFAP